MKRGELFSVAASGDYGKPRPAVIIQADALLEGGLNSVIICPLTSTPTEAKWFRIAVEPEPENGLKKASYIMVDKVMSVRRERLGQPIGRISKEQIVQLNRALAFVVGLT